jgi:O-methyltransferase
MNEPLKTKTELNELREAYKKEGIALIQYDHTYVHSYPYDAPWLTDAAFSALYEQIKGNTLVDRIRCFSLYLLTQQITHLDGDVLEIGVWRGGTAGIFATMLPAKTIFLADTFQGVIKSSEWEHYKDRAHDDTSIELVEDLLKQRLRVGNYEILPGIFPDDTGHLVQGRKWALVHIDVDVYLSAKETFHYVWEDVLPGGIVVFDDYGFFSACSGILKFIEEIKNDDDKLFIHNLNGHGYMIKKY